MKTTPITAANSIAPAHPAAHGTDPTGTAAPVCAIHTSHRAGHDANHANARAPSVQNGDTTAEPTPNTVAGATAGAASRLAGTATRLTCPESAAMTGAHATCAAAGTANASARPGGTPAARRPSRHRGASRISAPVASTDSANPMLLASPGSRSKESTTAAANAAAAARVRPVASASRPIAPIAAARNTLGDGRTRITNPTSASAASVALGHGGTRAARATRSSAPITIATLAPLTATRWVRPVARKSSASTGSRRLVSPSTSPGSSPPGSAGRVAHAACRPARNAPAASCVHCGLLDRSGGPVAVNTAAVRSPPRGGESRPLAVNRWLGSSSSQAGSLANTSTRASMMRFDPLPDSTRPVNRAGTSTEVSPG